MSDTVYLIFTIVGTIVGGIGGFIIGRYSIYRVVNMHNSIGNFDNPELEKEHNFGLGSCIMCCTVGGIFATIGTFITWCMFNELFAKKESLLHSALNEGAETAFIFGIICMLMGGLVIFASISSYVKNK